MCEQWMGGGEHWFVARMRARETDEIRPALSAEEWAKLSVVRDAHSYIAHEVDGRAFTARAYGQTACLDTSEGSIEIGDTVWQGRENLLALGALALHGYFTWEDVDMLRQPYINMPNLAARIADLLPPREER